MLLLWKVLFSLPRVKQICSGLLLSLWLQPASTGALFVPLALRVRGRSRTTALGLMQAQAQTGWGPSLCLACEGRRKGHQSWLKNWKTWQEKPGNKWKKKQNYGEKPPAFKCTLVHGNRVYMLYIVQDMGISGAEFRCEVWWISPYTSLLPSICVLECEINTDQFYFSQFRLS